jgi:hypothetical protein
MKILTILRVRYVTISLRFRLVSSVSFHTIVCYNILLRFEIVSLNNFVELHTMKSCDTNLLRLQVVSQESLQTLCNVKLLLFYFLRFR